MAKKKNPPNRNPKSKTLKDQVRKSRPKKVNPDSFTSNEESLTDIKKKIGIDLIAEDVITSVFDKLEEIASKADELNERLDEVSEDIEDSSEPPPAPKMSDKDINDVAEKISKKVKQRLDASGVTKVAKAATTAANKVSQVAQKKPRKAKSTPAKAPSKPRKKATTGNTQPPNSNPKGWPAGTTSWGQPVPKTPKTPRKRTPRNQGNTQPPANQTAPAAPQTPNTGSPGRRRGGGRRGGGTGGGGNQQPAPPKDFTVTSQAGKVIDARIQEVIKDSRDAETPDLLHNIKTLEELKSEITKVQKMLDMGEFEFLSNQVVYLREMILNEIKSRPEVAPGFFDNSDLDDDDRKPDGKLRGLARILTNRVGGFEGAIGSLTGDDPLATGIVRVLGNVFGAGKDAVEFFKDRQKKIRDGIRDRQRRNKPALIKSNLDVRLSSERIKHSQNTQRAVLQRLASSQKLANARNPSPAPATRGRRAKQNTGAPATPPQIPNTTLGQQIQNVVGAAQNAPKKRRGKGATNTTPAAATLTAPSVDLTPLIQLGQKANDTLEKILAANLRIATAIEKNLNLQTQVHQMAQRSQKRQNSQKKQGWTTKTKKFFADLFGPLNTFLTKMKDRAKSGLSNLVGSGVGGFFSSNIGSVVAILGGLAAIPLAGGIIGKINQWIEKDPKMVEIRDNLFKQVEGIGNMIIQAMANFVLWSIEKSKGFAGRVFNHTVLNAQAKASRNRIIDLQNKIAVYKKEGAGPNLIEPLEKELAVEIEEARELAKQNGYNIDQGKTASVVPPAPEKKITARLTKATKPSDIAPTLPQSMPKSGLDLLNWNPGSSTSNAVGNVLSGSLRGNPEIEAHIDAMGAKYGVDPNLIRAVIQQESSWNKNAVGPVTGSGEQAVGLMQLMPGTARSLGVTNSLDPFQNIEGGTKYLAQMIRQFGSIEEGLAAYNAGPGKMQKYQKKGYTIPPFRETQNYVRKITANYRGNSSTPTMVAKGEKLQTKTKNVKTLAAAEKKATTNIVNAPSNVVNQGGGNGANMASLRVQEDTYAALQMGLYKSSS